MRQPGVARAIPPFTHTSVFPSGEMQAFHERGAARLQRQTLTREQLLQRRNEKKG